MGDPVRRPRQVAHAADRDGGAPWPASRRPAAADRGGKAPLPKAPCRGGPHRPIGYLGIDLRGSDRDRRLPLTSTSPCACVRTLRRRAVPALVVAALVLPGAGEAAE